MIDNASIIAELINPFREREKQPPTEYIITEDELDELVMFGAVSLVTETRSRISELVVAIRARKCERR